MADPPAESVGPIDVLVTGGTGYIGQRLIRTLIARGHRVRAVVRPGSEGRVPIGAAVITGDPLDPEVVHAALRPADTVVHLVGTPHPNPSKAAEFERVDLGSVRALTAALERLPVRHLVYVSVAQPAPVMRAYVQARAESERLIRGAGVEATFIRPWYVLGPGHWWPVLLLPLYFVAALVPSMRAGARRLALVTVDQMVDTLVNAVEYPAGPGSIRVVEVPEIRDRKRAS